MIDVKITDEQKDSLISKGYYIEDMQAVWGKGWWNGLYRFMNDTHESFGNPQVSVESAWMDALQFEETLQEYIKTRGE